MPYSPLRGEFDDKSFATADAIYNEAKELGFLGPGAVETHIEHALNYLAPLQGALDAFTGQSSVDAGPAQCEPPNVPTRLRIVDLGTGGGVPGIVLSLALPSADFLFVDGMVKRCDFLSRVVREHGLANVEVVCGRAEDLGRVAELRERSQVVVARSFGPPAVLAECAAPLLVVGGSLLVSEPPKEASEKGIRWGAEALNTLGMRLDSVSDSPGAHIAKISKISPIDDKWPRRVGIPAKRPLF